MIRAAVAAAATVANIQTAAASASEVTHGRSRGHGMPDRPRMPV